MGSKNIFFLIILVTFLGVTRGQSNDKAYCNVDCGNKEQHTMCKYAGRNTKSCGTQKQEAVTQAQKDEILKVHNNYRQNVKNGLEKRGDPGPQPKAQSMPIMKWNDEISKIAQRLADQCTYGHDKCRNKLDGSYVGQNIFQSSDSRSTAKVNFTQAIAAWYEEVIYMDPAKIDPFVYPSNGKNSPNKVTGHYTQVLWAETTEVGCGYSSYRSADKKWYNQYVICNYAPGGNMQGGSMYKKA